MAGFDRRTVTIAPGRERLYDDREWRDALVLLRAGRIELEGTSGARCRLARGAIFWLDGVPLRALLNRGDEPAVLAVVTRRE